MAREARDKTGERLGANVKSLREHASVSQAELARRMTERGWPWHQSTVYRVESGRQPVRFEEAVDLADLLDVTLDRLAVATEEAGEQERAEQAHNRLRDSTVDAVDAVTQFHAARAGARQAAQEAASSDHAQVREIAALIAEELQHATIRSVLAAAQDRWMEQGGGLDSADTALLGIGSGDLSGRGDFPIEAVYGAAALYSEAAVTDVTSESLERLTEGMDPVTAEEVMAAVAEVASERRDGTVLRHIRKAGLEWLAAKGFVAEMGRLTREGRSQKELDRFFNQFVGSMGMSGRDEAVRYIEDGGDMEGLASLIAGKLTPEELAALAPLRHAERGGLRGESQSAQSPAPNPYRWPEAEEI